MARIRYIKPDFFFNEELAEISHTARLLFIALWCYADREGRIENRPKKLNAQIFPYEPEVDFNKAISELNPKFIRSYSVSGKNYISINNFNKHQKPHHQEKASVLPPYPKSNRTASVTIRSNRPVNGDGNGDGNGDLNGDGNGDGNSNGTSEIIRSEIKLLEMKWPFGDDKNVRIKDLAEWKWWLYQSDLAKDLPVKFPDLFKALKLRERMKKEDCQK